MQSTPVVTEATKTFVLSPESEEMDVELFIIGGRSALSLLQLMLTTFTLEVILHNLN